MQTMEYHTAMTKKFSSPDRKRDLRQHWLCEKSKLHNKNLTCEHFEWHVKVHMGHPWEAGPRGTSVFYKTCFSPLFGFSQWALIIFCIQKKKWKISEKWALTMSQLSEYLNPLPFSITLRRYSSLLIPKRRSWLRVGLNTMAKAPQPGATELGFNSIPGWLWSPHSFPHTRH